MRKVHQRFLAAGLAALIFGTAIVGAGCSAAMPDPDASSITVQETGLSEDQMESALRALAAKMQGQLRVSDSAATVQLDKNEDDSCKIAIMSNGEDAEAETYPSIQDCFAAYLEAGFFDAEGNVRGFSEVAESEPESEPTVTDVVPGMPILNEDNFAAGFPGEGQINLGNSNEEDAEPAESEAASEAAESEAVQSESEAVESETAEK